MIRKFLLVAFVINILLLNTSVEGQERILTDEIGRRVKIPNPVKRIISLAPSITEILFALGLNEQIVGEYILEGLLRLQIGFQKERIDMGILLLPAQRGDRTPYGSTRKLVEEEVQDLYPVIDLPVMIVLFDLGKPGESIEEEVQPGVQSKDIETESKRVPQETKPQEHGHPEIPSKTIPATKKDKPKKQRKSKTPSAK